MESESPRLKGANEPKEEQGEGKPEVTAAAVADGARVDVSASTITRMMGMATTTDIKLLEGRLELLSSKISQIQMKIERLSTQLSSAPTGSDIDRLEIQLGTVKSMVREVVNAIVEKDTEADEKSAAQEQSRKLRKGIRTNEDTNEK